MGGADETAGVAMDADPPGGGEAENRDEGGSELDAEFAALDAVLARAAAAQVCVSLHTLSGSPNVRLNEPKGKWSGFCYPDRFSVR